MRPGDVVGAVRVDASIKEFLLDSLYPNERYNITVSVQYSAQNEWVGARSIQVTTNRKLYYH